MERGKYAFTSKEYLQTGYEVKFPVAEAQPEREWQAVATDILRRESSIAAAMEHDFTDFDDKKQEGFEVYEDFPEEMVPYSHLFRGVGSVEERDFIMQGVKSEVARSERIAATSTGNQFFWSMMGYLGSPEIYPLLLADPLKGTGTFIKGALRLGGAAAVETAAHEGIMHQMQQTRNWKETAVNVGGAALLGGGLGGLIARLGGGRYRAALSEADDDLRTIGAQDSVDIVPGGSGGGAEARLGTLAEEAPVHPPRVTTKGFTIFHKLARAKVAKAHQVVNEYFQHTLSLGKNHRVVRHRSADGTITEETKYVPKVEALETAIEQEEATLFNALQSNLHAHFKAYSDKNRVWKGRVGGWFGKNKSWVQYNEEVMHALRNNDASPDPAVRAAAKSIRNDVMDVIKRFAVDEEKLPEDIVAQFAESYAPRRFNRLGMKARPEEFKEMTVGAWTPKWIEKKRQRLLDISARKLKKARATAPDEIESTLRDARELLRRAEVDKTFDESVAVRRQELSDAGKLDEADDLLDLAGLKKHVNALEKQRREMKKQIADSGELEGNIRKAEGRLKRSKKPETIKAIKKELAGMRKQLKAIKTLRKTKSDELATLKAEREALKTDEMGLDAEEITALRSAADDAYDNIMDGNIGEPMYAMPKGGSAFKGRVFDVHDNVLNAHRFLDNDVQSVLQSHIRSTLRPIMVAGKAGDAEMVEVLDSVRQAYNTEARVLFKAGKVDEANALGTEKTEILGLMQVARDRLYHRNTHHASNNITRNLGMLSRQLRRLNLSRMLGGVTVTSLADPVRMKISRTVMFAFKGDRPTFRKAMKTAKFNREAFDKSGIAAETASMSRTAAMMDASHMDTSVNRFDEFTRRGSNTFMRSTMLGGWTDYMKRWAAAAAQDNMWLEMGRYESLSHARKVFMAEQGFGPGEVARVMKMFDEFGEELPHGGTAFNWDNWTDREMATRVSRAIFRESETQIVSPGVLDRPSWADNEVGRSVLQFKSFSLAANNQVTLRMIDRMKTDKAEIPEAVNILVQQTLGGMVVTAAKMVLAGKAAEFEDMTMAEWVLNGIDRGGVVPMYTEGFNMVDMMSFNHLTGAVGSRPMRRYDRRNPLSFMGPTVGTAGDMVMASQAFSDGSWGEADTRLMRRLIPYNNLFYLRSLVDWAEGRYD